MVTSHPTAYLQFPGFQRPTYTPVPDELFDKLLSKLSGAELKVVMYITRRTAGFKRESDSISLTQIASGITTREGKVLDTGTGLSKRHVQRVLRSLEAKNIIRIARNVAADGSHTINVYSLNIASRGGTERPQGGDTRSPGGRDTQATGVETPVSTTTNSLPINSYYNKTVLVGGGVGALTDFGISEKAANRIASQHEEAYIAQKIEQVKWLMANQPEAVAKNPAGYLRRAIEENFSPPTGYYRQDIRPQEKEQAVLAREESAPEILEPASQEPMPASEDAKDNPWRQALERIKERQLVTRTVFTTWLRESRLLAMNGKTVTLGFANSWIANQVERQLYTVIQQAVAEVIGRPIDVQFSALEEAEEINIAA
jgi:hypothetical protein